MKTTISLLAVALILLSATLLAWLLHSSGERFRIAGFQTEEIQQSTQAANNSPTLSVAVSVVHPILKIDSKTGHTWIYRDEHYMSSAGWDNYVGWEELTNLISKPKP